MLRFTDEDGNVVGTIVNMEGDDDGDDEDDDDGDDDDEEDDDDGDDEDDDDGDDDDETEESSDDNVSEWDEVWEHALRETTSSIEEAHVEVEIPPPNNDVSRVVRETLHAERGEWNRERMAHMADQGLEVEGNAEDDIGDYQEEEEEHSDEVVDGNDDDDDDDHPPSMDDLPGGGISITYSNHEQWDVPPYDDQDPELEGNNDTGSEVEYYNYGNFTEAHVLSGGGSGHNEHEALSLPTYNWLTRLLHEGGNPIGNVNDVLGWPFAMSTGQGTLNMMRGDSTLTREAWESRYIPVTTSNLTQHSLRVNGVDCTVQTANPTMDNIVLQIIAALAWNAGLPRPEGISTDSDDDSDSHKSRNSYNPSNISNPVGVDPESPGEEVDEGPSEASSHATVGRDADVGTRGSSCGGIYNVLFVEHPLETLVAEEIVEPIELSNIPSQPGFASEAVPSPLSSPTSRPMADSMETTYSWNPLCTTSARDTSAVSATPPQGSTPMRQAPTRHTGRENSTSDSSSNGSSPANSTVEGSDSPHDTTATTSAVSEGVMDPSLPRRPAWQPQDGLQAPLPLTAAPSRSLSEATQLLLQLFDAQPTEVPPARDSDPSTALHEVGSAGVSGEAATTEQQVQEAEGEGEEDLAVAASVTERETAAAAYGFPQPWEGHIAPHFLVDLPSEMRSEIVFNNMELIRCAERPYVRLDTRTRISPTFLDQLPEETQRDILRIEERWMRITGVADLVSPHHGSGEGDSGATVRTNTLNEIHEILLAVEPDVRRDVLLTCNLDDLRDCPELLAEAGRLRAEQRLSPRAERNFEFEREQQQNITSEPQHRQSILDLFHLGSNRGEGARNLENVGGNIASYATQPNSSCRGQSGNTHRSNQPTYNSCAELIASYTIPAQLRARLLQAMQLQHATRGGDGPPAPRPPDDDREFDDRDVRRQQPPPSASHRPKEPLPPPLPLSDSTEGPRLPQEVLRECINLLHLEVFPERRRGPTRGLTLEDPITTRFVSRQLVELLQQLCTSVNNASVVVTTLLRAAWEGPQESAAAAAASTTGLIEPSGDNAGLIADTDPYREDLGDGSPPARGGGSSTPTSAPMVGVILEVLLNLIKQSGPAAMCFVLLPDGCTSLETVKSVDAPLDALEEDFVQHRNAFGLFMKLVHQHFHLNWMSNRCLLILNVLNNLQDSLERADEPNITSVPPADDVPPEMVLQHPRHCHRLIWTCVDALPNYHESGYNCNTCMTPSRDSYSYHCDICNFDLCTYCAQIRVTEVEQAVRLRRSAYHLLSTAPTAACCGSSEEPSVLSACLALLRSPRCNTKLASAIVKHLSRGLQESATRDGTRFKGCSATLAPPVARPAIEVVEKALIEFARAVCGEIKAARRLFRQTIRELRADALGESTAAGVSPVAADPLPPEFVLSLPETFRFDIDTAVHILHRMELKSTKDLTQQLVVLFAEVSCAEPRELSLLWHAVQAYLNDISLITQHLPEHVLIPLPSSVFTLLNGFCEYHICESRRSGTSISGSTQNSTNNFRDPTERFMMGMVSVEPSPISERAIQEVMKNANYKERNAIRKAAGRVEERRYLPRSVRKFLEANRSTLNALLYWDSSLLDSALPYLKSEPSLIDFTFKLNEFRSRIDIETNPHIKIIVDRSHCLEDSFNALKKVKTFSAPLQVQFRNEEGADAGGLRREWFQLLSNAIVNESYALFIHTREGQTYQPNPFSDVNALHLEYFHFVGLVLAMAITNNVALDVHFTRAVYRHIIGVQPVFQDLLSVDPELHANLRWVLENDVSDLGLSFAVSYDRFGEMREQELQPGGAQLAVTNDNKAQYVRQLCEFHMTKRTAPQLTSLLTGFYTVIPRDAIRMFTELELELVICGFVDYDIEDMRANTVYQGYTPSSPQVRWFWEVVAGMTKEDRANLLMFSTGSSKLPLGGFANLEGSGGTTQRFTIGRWSGSPDLLPQAHTCFNKINLPEYPTAEILREKLMLAITYGNMGFGML